MVHPFCLFPYQEAIKKCNNISGYAWEDPLKVRLRVTMDQLKKGGVLDDSAEDDSASSSSSVSLIATNGAEPPTLASKDDAPVSSPLVIEASS